MVAMIRTFHKCNSIKMAAGLMAFGLCLSPPSSGKISLTQCEDLIPGTIIAGDKAIEMPVIGILAATPPTLNPLVAPVADFDSADARDLAVVRLDPVYPSRALQRGIEGFTIVQFDIDETGSVINAEILAAEPPRIFDRASLNAIGSWRFKPMAETGETETRRGLRTRFRFQLND